MSRNTDNQSHRSPGASSGAAGRPSPSSSSAGTQAIRRTLDVLERFIEIDERGITDLADDVNLSPSTTHRIVRALVDRGYLEQRAGTNRYSLGLKAALIGHAGSRQLGLDRARAVLQDFRDETGESVNMGILEGPEVVVILRVPSPQPLRFDQPVGKRLPVHSTSMGKALLTFGDLSAVDHGGLTFTPSTPNTIVTVEELAAEIDATRQRGYSVDREESIMGVSCVGAPVLDRSGIARAAIAVQGPTVRMTSDRLAELGERIVNVASDVASVMSPERQVPTATPLDRGGYQ